MSENSYDRTRRFERAKELILVNYRVVDFERDLGEFDEGMTTSTIEISAGGMLLRMTENFLPRTLLDLRFKLRSEGKLITVLSVVTRTMPAEHPGVYYVAVDYPMLSDEDKLEIDHYVKEINSHRG